MYVFFFFCLCFVFFLFVVFLFFFFQAEDGIRDLVRSRGLGDVYKRQSLLRVLNTCRPYVIDDTTLADDWLALSGFEYIRAWLGVPMLLKGCILYTSDAADERSSVDLGGRRIIKKKLTV